jgi:hypothetical protein
MTLHFTLVPYSGDEPPTSLLPTEDLKLLFRYDEEIGRRWLEVNVFHR